MFTAGCLRSCLDVLLLFVRRHSNFVAYTHSGNPHKHHETTCWVELPFPFAPFTCTVKRFLGTLLYASTSSHRPYGKFGKTSPFPQVLLSRSTALRYIILLSKSELGIEAAEH